MGQPHLGGKGVFFTIGGIQSFKLVYVNLQAHIKTFRKIVVYARGLHCCEGVQTQKSPASIGFWFFLDFGSAKCTPSGQNNEVFSVLEEFSFETFFQPSVLHEKSKKVSEMQLLCSKIPLFVFCLQCVTWFHF